jgi:putative PEP-CTERM system TPR-repeat lipoprotein
VYKIIIIMLALLIGTAGCGGKTSEELYAEGIKLLREGKSGGAIVLFKNALEKNQNYLEARHQLAKAYLSEKKYELAEKEFQKVRRLNPNQPDINLDLAKLYNGLGKPDLAIRSAEEYLLEKANSTDALEVIGIAYRIKEMPQEAETFFLRALQIEPDKLTTKLELAAVHVGEGKTGKAKELLEEIVRRAPNNIRAMYLLAAIETTLGRKVEALALYKKLGEINPADPVAPYKAGLMHFEMEHFAIAEAMAAELIKKFPSQAEGYRLKGFIFYRNKNFPEAITSLQHANKLQPSLSGYYSLGLSLYANGELESALNQFRQILNRVPSFHQARLLTGTILLQQKRVDDAISELTKILESDDNNPLAHNMMGSAYIAKGMYEEGMRELEKATALDPKLIDAYMKKGMVHLSQGKTAEVEVDLKTAIQIAPELLNTRLVLSSFYEYRNNRAKALATLNQGLTNKKSDAILYCGMSKILFADNKADEAVRSLSKAKESDRASVAPYFMLGAYYTGIRNTEKALKEYSDVLQKEPGNVKAMLQSAALLESNKRYNEAVAWYLKAKETRDPTAYLALSRYYERRGDTGKSLSTIVESSQYIPRSADLLEQRVRLYQKNGQFKEALKTCDDIEAISPERAISKRVTAYTAMGRKSEAIKEAERAISLKPDSSYGYMLLASVYQEQNNPGLAIETLKKGLLRDGSNPQAALTLAVLYSKSGNHSLSLKTCEDILLKRPNYAPAYYTQGTLLEAKGSKNDAVKKYRAAIALSNTYAAPLNNLAYLYLDGYGSKEEALLLAERAFALDPENPGILDTLGYALLKNNRHQEAREYLGKAVALLPGEPTINYHLALAHRASGDKKQATERLQIALRTGKFEEVQQAKTLLEELK